VGEIPAIGEYGIPLRELVLELALTPLDAG
jgi:hypothetical protein